MPRAFLLAGLLIVGTLSSAAAKKHSYLFAWCGDTNKKATDFLAVIDADPASPHYGQVLRTAPTGVAGNRTQALEVVEPQRKPSPRPQAKSSPRASQAAKSGCR